MERELKKIELKESGLTVHVVTYYLTKEVLSIEKLVEGKDLSEHIFNISIKKLTVNKDVNQRILQIKEKFGKN